MWANQWGGTWPIQQSAYQNMPHEQGKNTHSVFSSFLLAVLHVLLYMPISEITKTLSSGLLVLWSLAYEEEEKSRLHFVPFTSFSFITILVLSHFLISASSGHRDNYLVSVMFIFRACSRKLMYSVIHRRCSEHFKKRTGYSQYYFHTKLQQQRPSVIYMHKVLYFMP